MDCHMQEVGMRRNSNRILTSHVGSLPRPEALIQLNRAQSTEKPVDEDGFQTTLRDSVKEVVRRQKEMGIDIPNDGEYGHAMGSKINYRAWWTYVFQRLGGLELADVSVWDMPKLRSEPGKIRLTSFGDRRDRLLFAEAYSDPESGITTGKGAARYPVCRGTLTYTGHGELQRDIDNVKTALKETGVHEGFMNSVAPGSCARFANEYYKNDEEFLFACADVMREEYKAIVDAGLVLQLDDPCIAENWDQIHPEPSVEEYRKFTMVRVEALNHAIAGLPSDRIRFHLCWGSWHGPHVTDIPLRDIVDLMLAINAGAYLIEAGNVRHEHEWKVWQDVKLPEGKILMPGFVSHATNIVEHPEVVADRIVRYAQIVGRENVIASTDCGLGGRVHPQIAWAKLESLVRGAELASKRLW
jgi:5-methyltetrahydropteroyltriglutamate--homocysteine methyltransferase